MPFKINQSINLETDTYYFFNNRKTNDYYLIEVITLQLIIINIREEYPKP